MPDTTSPVVTYQVIRDGEQWQVWHEKKVIHVAPESFYIFMFLTRNLPAQLIIRCQRQIVFHAAGLAHQQHGIILCGASNSGKSTLTAWLTATGFDFLADDMCAIDIDTLALHGWSCPVVLKAGSQFVWERWLDDADRQAIQFFGGAAWVDPELLRPGAVIQAARTSLLIFPRYLADHPLTVEPLSAAEVLFRLLPRVINFANLPQRGLAPATRLARQVSAFSMTYSDIEVATAWLRQTVIDLDQDDR